jgi:hypothetical protein
MEEAMNRMKDPSNQLMIPNLDLEKGQLVILVRNAICYVPLLKNLLTI